MHNKLYIKVSDQEEFEKVFYILRLHGFVFSSGRIKELLCVYAGYGIWKPYISFGQHEPCSKVVFLYPNYFVLLGTLTTIEEFIKIDY